MVRGSLNWFAGIVGTVVTINTAITTCSNQTIARYTGFRGAVTAEETFWKERFDDYFAALALDRTSPQRKAKLAALSALADHPTPDFSEYWLGPFGGEATKHVATERLDHMRASLQAAIADPDSSDPEVAEKRQAANSFDNEQKAPVQARTEAAVTAQAKAVTEAQVIRVPDKASHPSRDTQVLSAGDETGWDVDVFWCAGGGSSREAKVYAEALDVATRLKEVADARHPIAPSVTLGRIRLRVLPELRQGADKGYPGSGYVIKYDAGEGESVAALALRTTLESAQLPFTVEEARTKTRWYLSVFVCE
jgi:hypothetical protein